MLSAQVLGICCIVSQLFQTILRNPLTTTPVFT